MKAPQWLHRKIAAIPGFFWRRYCESSKAAKQEALRQQIEQEITERQQGGKVVLLRKPEHINKVVNGNAILRELAAAGLESQARMEREINSDRSIRGFVE